MTSQERVLCALNHVEPDRVPVSDGPWATTIARWHKEGLPTGIGPAEYFGYEFVGFGGDLSLQLPQEVIEDTDEYTIVRNSNGATVKNWKHRTSTPELLGFLITDRKTWEEYKPRLSMNESRVNWEHELARNRKARESGFFCTFNGVVGYDRMAMVVGPETLLMAIVEDPDWVRDLFDASVQLVIDMAEEMIARGFEFDAAFLCDDLGYRKGTFFSPQAYRELLFPAHKRACDFFHSKGMKTILHSCGNVNALVPHFIEAGWDCLQPLEVKAGMDIIKLKRDYGDALAFMGGIDVRKMAHPNPHVIEDEIRTKFEVAKAGGGYIYHSDHSVPDNVSFEQYKWVMQLVHKYGRYD
ncbi:MAG TPA: hypothetical protein EYP10_12060 [Armatimonadetes bacterium]|nr:hypothetical protein [Armatimonadota bacterium]